jgi:4-alpha-glucanotransferase
VDEASRARIEAAVGGPASDKNINRELIALAMHSIASTAIFPLQDVLNLGAEARMNLPGTGTGNWEWRLLPEHLTAGVEEYLAELTQASKRV